ncbi:cytochrome b [Oceanobacter mangrovi]|uniref:cytochrome b n=1 Tax=Oceanobacter mangrovi TaxID=2862510 RepID=UPI001C8D7EF0|nr:cytochrome b [Oceanobacter mangrovi]
MTSDIRNYNLVSKLFHWGSAVLILGMIVVGLMMEDMEGPEKFELMGLHKSFGALLLFIVIARILNRFLNPVDDLPEMTAKNIKLAKMGHGLLYLCMLIMPISGILMSQSGGHAVSMFGWELPTLVGKEHDFHEFTEGVHGVTANVLILLILGHAGAAIYHHIFMKDRTLLRMGLRKL